MQRRRTGKSNHLPFVISFFNKQPLNDFRRKAVKITIHGTRYKAKKAPPVKQVIISQLQPVRQLAKTIIFNNGTEFTHHKSVANALDCDTNFATPSHSWEWGQNENGNRLLRQYFS